MSGIRGMGSSTKTEGLGFRRSLRRASRVGNRRHRPLLESLETRQLLTTYFVTDAHDRLDSSTTPPPGSPLYQQETLRDAITWANNDKTPDNIEFDIPASTSADLATPVYGFDPITQTWRITLNSQLPQITNTVTIDGYSQARVGVPFRYPTQAGLAIQSLALVGSPTGGTFTLTTQDSIMTPGGQPAPSSGTRPPPRYKQRSKRSWVSAT